MSYDRNPQILQQPDAPRRDATNDAAHKARHATIAKVNGDRYRDHVQQINKMQEREIQRALLGT